MTMNTPNRTVAPASTPVSVLDARAHLRLTGHEEDTLVAALIAAATDILDGWSGILGRCIVTQTWTQSFEEFDGDDLHLPFPDVQSVTVQYYDANNASQTLSSSAYHLINSADGAELELAYGQVWPNVYPRPDAITVTMVCGYGDPADVPSALKAAVLLHVGHLFANREAIGSNSLAELPLAYKFLTAPYRRIGL